MANPWGTAMTAVPATLAGSALVCVGWGLATADPAPLALAASIVYLVPPMLHRLHDRIAPLEPGMYAVVGDDYLPWWGSHQLQLLFVTFPALEAALRLVPGLYSAWLRLWGARVGRAVYWTPRVQLLDRSLLDIGDGVVFGHEAGASAHVITVRKGELKLFVSPITVGAGAMIGARAVLSPGATVTAGARVPAQTVVGVNATWTD
ncbi:MAG: acyl transferase [Myxococcota bacterium]